MTCRPDPEVAPLATKLLTLAEGPAVEAGGMLPFHHRRQQQVEEEEGAVPERHWNTVRAVLGEPKVLPCS